MSLYQRWMQIPPGQRIIAAGVTGVVAYGAMKITDYYNEQGDIQREAEAIIRKEREELNSVADKDFRRKE